MDCFRSVWPGYPDLEFATEEAAGFIERGLSD